MRMTNKIMQNNSLYNINNNKILQDKLSTQMSTQKKLTRPSDDPVIAIRALRLRTSVAELSQYYDKNAPDAESWLDVTGKALGTVTDVLTDMTKQANKAANKDLGSEDLRIIVEQIKSLRDEFYSTGNVDYAGRYVFTGYRTDTTMSFTKEVEENPPSYSIIEQNKIGDFDSVNYTDIGNLEGMNKNDYGAAVTEQDVSNDDIHRMRLAYDDLKDDGDNSTADITIKLMKNDGSDGIEIAASTISTSHNPDPYKMIQTANNLTDQNAAEANVVIFVPETGEVLFSDKAYTELQSGLAGADYDGVNTEIRFQYTKNQWESGDLRPEHYFACTATITPAAGAPETINYNQEYLSGTKTRQAIEYDVGYNQTIQVNTTADEVFNHNLDRDVDDLEKALTSLTEIEATKIDLENVMKGLTEGTTEYNDVKTKYDAADKAYSYIREKIHKMFEGTITSVQGYLDDTNVAITDNGTRSQRLDLISNRLMDQKTTFKTLQSENEDADIAEVAVQLTSTELTYNAALMATGKIMQTSLMNYI